MNQRMNEEKNALPMTRGQIENFIKENYKTKLTSLFTSLQLLLTVFDKSISFLPSKCKNKQIMNNRSKESYRGNMHITVSSILNLTISSCILYFFKQ